MVLIDDVCCSIEEREQFERGAVETGIALSLAQKELFRVYCRELLTWNRRINLISKGDERRIATRHFLDSLTGVSHLPPKKGLQVIDIGAGAGFPGLPLKIARDDLRLTLVESRRKKTLFLRHIVMKLDMGGVEVIQGRIEQLTSLKRSFDVALSRGVAKLSRLLRVSFPVLKPGGTLIAYKGKKIEEEVVEALPVLKEVGGEFIQVKRMAIPFLESERSLILARKGTSG